MYNMYNICKQNAENSRETRNFVLKRHRNKKLCKNVFISKHIKSNKNEESHIYIQNFTVYSRCIGHFKLFINQRKFVKLDICTH